MSDFPRVFTLRQSFQSAPKIDFEADLRAKFSSSQVLERVKPGAKIAVAAGSRGISNLSQIVGAAVKILKSAGADVFIVPAMGSHGGATPEGQIGILADYGVTESAMGAPIRASMETKQIATSAENIPVHFSVDALAADGIVVINRVKPHTDFFSTKIGSGLLKMLAIGLGKRNGAIACHGAAQRIGYERVLLANSAAALNAAPVLCAIGVIENQLHQTAKLEVVARANIQTREPVLLAEARAFMPALPFDDIDILVVDQIGKNISGAGMDPNIIGRGIHGYFATLAKPASDDPHAFKGQFIRRIFVRGVTPQSHGNAVGIGMADFTTTRCVRAIDKQAMFINSLTALSLQTAKIPMHFDTDREIMAHAVKSLATDDPMQARIVRIRDTLSLETCEVSESLFAQAGSRKASGLREMAFDGEGNLDDAKSYLTTAQ